MRPLFTDQSFRHHFSKAVVKNVLKYRTVRPTNMLKCFAELGFTIIEILI